MISLPCPGCRGMQYLTPDLECLSCYYCGKDLTVDRTGGGVSLVPFAEGRGRTRQSTEAIPRPHDRVADELLLRRVATARQTAESGIAEEQLRLDQVSVDHWISWSWERLFIVSGFAGAAIGTVGGLDALVRGIRGETGFGEAIVHGGAFLLVGGLLVRLGLSGWSRLSGRRRESALIQERQRALRDMVGQLSRREVEIRRRLET